MPDTRDHIMSLQSSLRAYRSSLSRVGVDGVEAECAASLAALTLANTEMLLHLGRELEQMAEDLSTISRLDSATPPAHEVHALPDAAPEPIEAELQVTSTDLQSLDHSNQI